MKKKILIIWSGIVLFWPIIISAAPIYNPANGNYYEEIWTYGVPWLDANEATNSMWYMNMPGHLVTITSAEENEWLVNNLSFSWSEMWIGAYQDPWDCPPDQNWRWATDWEPWVYTNWSGPEPNDYFGWASENYGGIWGNGSWNDEACLGHINGYIVEYEPIIPEPPSTLLLVGFGLVGILYKKYVC